MSIKIKFYRETKFYDNCVALFCDAKGRWQRLPNGKIPGFGASFAREGNNSQIEHTEFGDAFVRNRTRKVSLEEVQYLHPNLLAFINQTYGAIKATPWGAVVEERIEDGTL